MSVRGSSRKSRTILTNKKGLMADAENSAANQATQKGAPDQTGSAQPGVKHKKAAYLQSLNESEKADNFKIIDKMNKRINFLRNPRFKANKAPITLNKRPTGSVNDKNNPFAVEPKEIVFVDYQINGVYEIPLKITNNSTISRRFKYRPPETEHFSIRNIKYPSNKESMIAPGMSILINIAFFAPSFADFNDALTIVTEENSFEIPIIARREPPVIKLVNPMDNKSCWIGDRVDMVFRCTNTGGDGGFKFFCERDEDDSRQEEADTIKLGPFTLYPSEFYLYSGNAQDIFVSFHPTEEGLAKENLILACDNHTSEFYELQGYGAMLDLDVIEVDGRPVDTKLHPLDAIFFPNTNPQTQACRVITVKNSSPILVSYHWSLYTTKSTQKIVLQDEETHYKIEPSQGKISAGEIQHFKIFFFPEHASPYYEYCDFIVEDLPINSMRNPPEALVAFAENNKSEMKIAMPTYIGSNTQYLSIPYLQFDLKGQGNFREMIIEPPVLTFKEALYINKSYTQNITMKKDRTGSDKDATADSGSSGYKKSIRVEGKSDESFEVEIDTRQFNESTTSEDDIDITVTILSKTCGRKTAFIMIEIEDGIPLSYFIEADFKGPLVSIVESNVEFGLQKINSHTSFTMNITNHSPIEAPILLKNANDFQNHTFSTYLPLYQSEQSKPQKSSKSVCQITTSSQNKITFSPQYLIIPANSRGEVTVTLTSTTEEIVSEILEVLVENGESQYIFLNANIQRIKVCLNRYNMDLGKIYAGIKQSINKRHPECIVLKNYGNIPAKFQWNEKVSADQLRVQFEPARGVIAPHSEFVVNIKLTTYIGGDMEEIFTCDVTDFDFPLGFVCKANVFGLRVVHTLPDYVIEAQKQALSMGEMANKTGLLTTKTLMQARAMEEEEEAQEQDPDEKNRLKALKFPACTINKPSAQKFVLKNLSGIKTTFNFKALTYEPDDLVVPASIQGKSSIEDLPKQDADETITISKPGSRSSKRDTTINVRFALTSKTKKGLKVKQLKRPLLTDSHEHQNKFQSKTGETFTATKRLEREQAFYLSNNKGLAVVFSPAFGELKPHAEIPVNVTIYNNACGRFEDIFVSEIKGLPPMKFPIHVSISGSPLIIPENQVGLNYYTTPPTMAFPTVVDNSPQLMKSFKIKNTGIADVNIDWKIFDERDQKTVDQESDLFNITIGKNTGFDSEENPFKLNFALVEPEPSQDSPFEIEPKSVIIPARETQFFEVKFNSDQGVDTFKAVILAHPKLAEDLEVYDEYDNKIEDVVQRNKPVDPYDLNSGSSEDEGYYGQQYAKQGRQDYDMDHNSENDHRNGGEGKDREDNSENDAQLEAAKRSLGIVALKLFAKTIEPVLTVDMKKKLDGEFYFNFYQWPMDHDEEPSPIQKMCLVNETKANIIFNLSTEGPFKIVDTKTNSGSVHPLAPKRPSSKGLKAAPLTMFSLQPDKLVQMKVEFSPPDPNNAQEWPLVQHTIKKGMINVAFANGKMQHFNLLGNCIRPKVSIITMKPCKNEKGVDEIDLGEVNIEKSRQSMFYLINETAVPSKWSLNYVKFPKKATLGYMTQTPLEIENSKKTDDPDVFQFSVTTGCLKGPSLPLRVTPEGLALPSVPKNSMEEEYLPLKIQINFKPKQNILYKSMFRFVVEKGMSYDVIFKGKGSYEEDYDDD